MAHQDRLSRPQLGHAETAQGFHVDEISGVPSPRVKKPNPRKRLNHFTTARSRPLVGVTETCVRGGNSAGWTAVELSIDIIRNACMPFGRASASQTMRAPS